jgi:protein involved in polysaccharide export with SLBB domain
LVLFAAVCLFQVVAGSAQNQRSEPAGSSDLGRQNLSYVAASVADLKTILIKDPGLMVELKRWVARDATEHGQVISDSDLTNSAIFERMETDSQFRSIATTLVQRYGYLLPKVDPDSELGKERELLMQERSKWLAQNQEEQLAAARQRKSKSSQDSNPSRQEQGQPEPQQPPSLGGPVERTGLEQGNPRENAGENSSGLIRPGTELSESSLGPEDGLSADPQMRGRDLNPQDNRRTGVTGGTVDTDGPSGTEAGRRSVINNNGGDGASELASVGLEGIANGSGLPGGATNQYIPAGMSPVVPVLPSNRRQQQNAQKQPVEMVRQPSPYTDIPSLYDMYLQAVTRPTTPKRFASEVFENGTRDPQMIPMDLPVGPDYVVGPGDGLSIDLWGGVSQRFFRTVDREGRISLPEAGPVLVSGKSLGEVQQDLQQILRGQFRGVSAEVSLARLRSIRIYEVGDVASPGAYDISSLSTPLNALFAAGGPTPKGSLRIVKHLRGNQVIQEVDLYDLLVHGVQGDMVRLENGDSILVPPVGPEVTIEGMVHRPAIYELKTEKTLASVIELAGGLLPSAALRHIEVQRLEAHEKRTMLNLDIPDNDDTSEVTKKLASFEIHDGDRIRIFPIAPYNQDVIFLDGHVIRPGRYSYRENMRVTDLVSSYRDLLPEPAGRYAEIIRLNAPDFHPTVESFDLADALANPAQAPVLHPLDTVRIFSRYDFESPPTVSVLGDVRMPGTYRTSGQVRLDDAVHLAGGVSPDAQVTDAQVFRYLPDGKFKIFSVNLDQALAGDPTENILLQARDRLLIHRNPQAVEPATVYIEGDVARPGRYPLTTNMKAGDLIRVGGGLKPSADTTSADLTRFEYGQHRDLTAQHEVVDISAALSGDAASDVAVHNGDVLTVRELPGWNDLGASISVKGSVKSPGTYGIRPGEKLSAILERAGGFLPDAYPYGAVLERVQVRELQSRDQDRIIVRVKDEESHLELLPDTDPDKKRAKDKALEQWQTTLEELSSNPPQGRVTIRISGDIRRWKNTVADVDVRAGDTLVIPKKPSYVMVTGQVFNPTAVSYRPGKSAEWYLGQSGGPTQLAYKKAIFVIRADGSVLGTKGGVWSGDSLGAALRPGDTVVVPEKAIGGGIQVQTVLLAAQVAASIASAVFIAVRY